MCGPIGQGVEDTLVVLCNHGLMLTVVPLARFLNRFERDVILGGGAAHFIKQIANDLVAYGCYSHPPPLPHKLDNHASPCKRLARARRSLDWQH